MTTKRWMKGNGTFLHTLVLGSVLAVAIIVFFHTYQLAQVSGGSMTPTLEDHQYVLIHKKKEPKRYDLAVFSNENNLLIKRVIGLPGDSFIRSGTHLLLGDPESMDEFSYRITVSEEVADSLPLHGTIPKEQYFVIGDCVDNSRDSRIFGMVSSEAFVGTVSPLTP